MTADSASTPPNRPPADGSHAGHDHGGHDHAAHDRSHDHGHDHAPGMAGMAAHAREAGRKSLVLVLALTSVFMVVEFVGGLLANSLALLADSAHMLTDVGALALSLFAIWFAQRPATPEKTYGYLRLEILAALLNGATLLVLAFFIILEAWERLQDPVAIRGRLMLGVAAAGLAVNVVAALVLHRSAGENLNVRGAYLHVLGDLLGSVGAITAAVIILATGWTLADPIISVLVALLIAASSISLLRESVDVLLEAVPRHLDVEEIRDAILGIEGVEGVHDLHVWTVTSGYFAMSGHAVVEKPADNPRVLHEIHDRLRQFGIGHVTVQIEQPALYSIRSQESELGSQ